MTIKPAYVVAAVLFASCQPAAAFDEEELLSPAGGTFQPQLKPAPEIGRMPRDAPALAAPSVLGPGHLRLGDIPVGASIDLTVPATNLWQRIRNGFALPDIEGALVREQESWYATRPDYVRRMVARSQRYLYFIVEEVEKRRMPTEIALLPMIESAYNPTAYSRSHASGIWQFIPSTGRLYGLQQDWWQDERRDVLSATRAALDYLEKLYDQFGSWDLALAAYNWGEGAVSRALAKNQAQGLPADYLSLNMPKETRYYVPKLQAVKNIVAHPEQFGIDLAQIQNQPYFTSVSISQHIDAKLAARLAEMPLDEFLSLNPAHNRPVIRSANGKPLLLPADKARVFSANLQQHDRPLVSWQIYSPRRGERLDKIAAKFGISLAQLEQINSLPPRHKTALAGRTLLVPMRNLAGESNLDKVAASPADVAVEAEPARQQTSRLHVLTKGETLFSVARRYKVSVQQLHAWNKLRSDHVAPGQKLVVGHEAAPPVPARANIARGHHPVKSHARSRSASVVASKKRVSIAYTAHRKRR